MERKFLTYKKLKELFPDWKLKKRKSITKFVIEKESDTCYCVKEIIALPLYIAILPLTIVLELLCCIWDGGIKSFALLPRCLFRHTVFCTDYGFDKLDNWFKN